jgi:hypothetical protein
MIPSAMISAPTMQAAVMSAPDAGRRDVGSLMPAPIMRAARTRVMAWYLRCSGYLRTTG